MAADPLIDAAIEASKSAVAPYSNFAVGAALRDTDGKIWTGANVENASYTLGLCAERVAVFYAITHGATGFTDVVIATPTDQPTPPCGACRQILFEFARDASVVMVTTNGATKTTTVVDLMPEGFDATNLGG